MSPADEYFLKICLLGSPDSLKHTILRAFVKLKPTSDYRFPGLAISNFRFSVDSIYVKLSIVTIANKQYFEQFSLKNPDIKNTTDLRSSYYRGAAGGLVFFNKCESQSFDEIPGWVEEFQRIIPPPVPLLMVGLSSHSDDCTEPISFIQAQTLASQLNLPYMETSPTDRQTIYKIFVSLVKQAIDHE